MIFVHAGGIGRDGGALNGYFILFRGICGIDGYLVIGFIPVFQAQVIIFRLQINKWQQQVVFNHLPENPGHFISVHFYDGGSHLNLIHVGILLFCVFKRPSGQPHLSYSIQRIGRANKGFRFFSNPEQT